MAFANQGMSWDEMELANCFPLHKACKDGDSPKVVTLLLSNRELAEMEDRFFGWTPAHWAAYFGKLDCLRNVMYSLMNGANFQTSKLSVTPAHCAADAGQAYSLLWLLKSGANPNLKDFYGETPLHKCARNGSAECAAILIEMSCNVRAVNNAGESASTVAERNGHPEIAAYIHEKELAQELGGQFLMNVPNGLKRNFSNSISFAVNEGQLARKRGFDEDYSIAAKRTRHDDPIADAAPVVNFNENQNDNSMSCESSSVVEHEKLCRVERRYNSRLLQCMIADFHGC